MNEPTKCYLCGKHWMDRAKVRSHYDAQCGTGWHCKNEDACALRKIAEKLEK